MGRLSRSTNTKYIFVEPKQIKEKVTGTDVVRYQLLEKSVSLAYVIPSNEIGDTRSRENAIIYSEGSSALSLKSLPCQVS